MALNLNNLAMLPTRHWVTDYGFRRYINERFSRRNDLGDYYQREKSHKSLLELIKYQDEDARRLTLEYFELPFDTRAFLDWVYMWVAYQHREEMPDGVMQDDIFPYPQLYAIWLRETGPRSGNILVYRDSITDTDGRELMRLPAPLTQPLPAA